MSILYRTFTCFISWMSYLLLRVAPLPAATCQQLSLPRIRSIASLFSLSSDDECFDETGGTKAPTGIYWKPNLQVTSLLNYKNNNNTSRDPKREEENTSTKEDYNIFWIHRSKRAECLAFALRVSNFISFLKVSFTECKLVWMLLKIRSFLAF